MPIRDTEAMNASLDNDYGATAGPASPAQWDLALFTSDPIFGGAEVTVENGYTRTTFDQADWEPASDGKKRVTVAMAAPTGTWDTATHFGVFEAGTETMWDCAPLSEPLDVTGAADDGPVVTAVVFYNNLEDTP